MSTGDQPGYPLLFLGYSIPMPSRLNRHTPTPLRRRKRRGRRIKLASLRRFVRARWRMFRKVTKAVLASPPTVRTVVILAAILICWLGVNWTYHTFNKPSEVFFPLDRSLNKSPAETWKQYGSLFREHATAVITPELLAALAQVEGEGTRWRGPTGDGICRGIPWIGTNRRRARSVCTRSPTEHSTRRRATASTTIWWSRTAPGTIHNHAGSTASTSVSCQAMPSS